jgi:hypothetical protein
MKRSIRFTFRGRRYVFEWAFLLFFIIFAVLTTVGVPAWIGVPLGLCWFAIHARGLYLNRQASMRIRAFRSGAPPSAPE